MSYFKLSEFIKDSDLDRPEVKDRDIIAKIKFWQLELDKVRPLVGFPIKITDSVRWGDGTSQHYYKSQGAIDLRPLDKYDQDQFYRLGLALYANPNIKRICFYPKGKLFAFGGFHIDCKTPERNFYISDPDKIIWKPSIINGLGSLLLESK